MKNTTIAAAVALVLGGASAAHADSCAAPTYALYVGGSSAAKPAFQTALASDLFASTSTFSSTNGDFEAFCGPLSGSGASNTGLTAGKIATVYYRVEGGSVVGALPIVSGKTTSFLDLSGAGCNVTNPPTTGTSQANGADDSWGGCVTEHQVELGVTDLEPTVFYTSGTVTNYPTAYSTTVFGTASVAQLGQLNPIPLFQQVFGIFVNTSGINGGASGQAINLSKETVAAILAGKYKDWSLVPSASGGAVSSTSQAITIENREAGSGTRTGASIYFLGQECTTLPLKLKDGAASNDSYATSDVLKVAAGVPGAITYASIDNNGKQANLSLASLSGVAPTNLAAASGQYDYWFEATAILGNTTGTTGGITSPGGSAIAGFLTGGELQNLATAPHAVSVNAIPTAGSNSSQVAVPLVSSTVNSKTIYINPFTRSGNSCNIPAEQN